MSNLIYVQALAEKSGNTLRHPARAPRVLLEILSSPPEVRLSRALYPQRRSEGATSNIGQIANEALNTALGSNVNLAQRHLPAISWDAEFAADVSQAQAGLNQAGLKREVQDEIPEASKQRKLEDDRSGNPSSESQAESVEVRQARQVLQETVTAHRILQSQYAITAWTSGEAFKMLKELAEIEENIDTCKEDLRALLEAK